MSSWRRRGTCGMGTAAPGQVGVGVRDSPDHGQGLQDRAVLGVPCAQRATSPQCGSACRSG